MLIVTESKAQGWRAVAILNNGAEALLYVGRSSTQVRGGYGEAYHEGLDEEERGMVTEIKLQQWQGAPDAGKWIDKNTLRLPAAPKSIAVKVAA